MCLEVKVSKMAVSRNYFQKFPTISYNDYVVRDVSVRTKLTQYLQETGVALLPYTIKEGERADSIAAFYYNDPYYAWAIYLVNGIIDPYAEWPKSSVTLNEYIEATYGSVEAAQDTILRYEVDWASDTSLLSPAQYEALPQVNKKYWEPQFGYNREIISYYRKELDWILDNNRLDKITVVSNSSVNSLSSAFEIGERLYQYNYLNDVAVKSTVLSVDTYTDANTIDFQYTNSTFYDLSFSSGNTSMFVTSTSKLAPFARVSGTNIPANTYVKHIIDGTTVELSAAPTGSPTANSTYEFLNPATATLVVQKVDFSEVIFASNTTLAAPDSFFTYAYENGVKGTFTSGNSIVTSTDTTDFSAGQVVRVAGPAGTLNTSIVSIASNTQMTLANNATFTGIAAIYGGDTLTYHDERNYVVGRKNGANVVVLTHLRLDTNTEPVALLANSQLPIEELSYWKSVSAYDDEIAKNEQRKEIYVLDNGFINTLDDNLEAIAKNV